MEQTRLLPLLTIPVMLVIVELAALLLTIPMQSAGITAFEDPESVANPFIFIIILLVFTGFLLLLLRFKWKKLIGAIIGLSIFFTFIYIFAGITGYFLGLTAPALLLTLVLSVAATALLYLYPEWYVIDALGILIAAGAASIFGISLSIVPVIILLIILLVYDAISVYKTKHMITLAEGVVDMKSPILFIVPKKRGYRLPDRGNREHRRRGGACCVYYRDGGHDHALHPRGIRKCLSRYRKNRIYHPPCPWSDDRLGDRTLSPAPGGPQRKAPGRPSPDQWRCNPRIFSRVWPRPAPLNAPGNR